MTDEILALSYCEATHQHAMLADNGVTSWLYLHGPSVNAQKTGPVIATAFAYSRIDPIPVSEVKEYQPEPPPIAIGYATKTAVCDDPSKSKWHLTWSTDGVCVLLLRDDQPWCLVHPSHTRGCSKSIGKTGPWGDPWSETLFQDVQWPLHK